MRKITVEVDGRAAQALSEAPQAYGPLGALQTGAAATEAMGAPPNVRAKVAAAGAISGGPAPSLSDAVPAVLVPSSIGSSGGELPGTVGSARPSFSIFWEAIHELV
jgi:hypothetical protein